MYTNTAQINSLTSRENDLYRPQKKHRDVGGE